ncbi:ABC-2 type transporter-domain-containing protein [Fusarium oxysporum Fo47]|uniref:ABC-2 type transporter-domain-containing protein n=1 Tax=Fusarium oxysporum Fo47 TaxID=660027 RepID=UPI002869AB63|nr:ABC-2 type transporter-domain-containing protein [Fusarium oxysporum Fo47]WJG37364.1 ABC-2 type transporter-domain-containing protein [Fusarium oxysporum Fo47]
MYAIAPPSTPQDTEAETAVEDTAEPVLQLARTFSLTRTFSALSTNINPFLAQDSHLDPKSPDFEPESWVKALLHTFSKDPSKHPRYTAGVSWRNLSVHGFSDPTEFQKDVFNVIWRSPLSALNWFAKRKQKVKIISDFDGLVKSGELLLVLGRPGSGVSTLLKTIAGHTHGLHLDDSSEFNYQGIPWDLMHRNFRGEVIYQAETDIHFPQLTVGDTLLFAALARTPQHIIANISRHVYAEHMRDAVMAMFGISNTLNTKVGDDFVRGVSGGERKREFDKVLLLYEGRQIFFGPTSEATQYFTAMGFECPPRQTTADFLTSLTNPDERIVRPGFENKVPRSPDEFADEWRMSQHRSSLLSDIAAFEIQYPLDGKQVETLKGIRRAQKAKFTSDKSPFTISIPMQIHLCIGRGVKRLLGDKTFFVVTIAVNFVMSLVLGSVYFDLPSTADAMNRRASVIFFAILFNGLSSALEILALYVQRPIVEKHARYALYRPLSESVSSIICDLPSKIISTLAFNIPLYFMVHLRRDASAFFIFLLFGFTTTMTMSMILRTIAQSSKTVHQALVPAAIFIIGLVIYAGFVLPIRSMKGWLRWINYVNPIAYAYESLVANEFSGRSFGCQTMIPSGPGYEDIEPMQRTCSVAGALPGRDFIDGDFFMGTVYKYHYSHLWRNYGILIAFIIFFTFTYLFAAEYFSSEASKGEVLVFRKVKKSRHPETSDEEAVKSEFQPAQVVNDGTNHVPTEKPPSSSTFCWRNVCYDVKVKGETRRILSDVNGWVQPGKLTALMGATGAGKTTLLDVLADRVTMGVITGDILVNGLPRGKSFQRTTGYVQQQDIHLETSTVREALRFSAALRQPSSVCMQDKIDYVEEVISLLEMGPYADAVIGVSGKGLNVEQRKRLSIGVELVAKPEALIFLDEPTSGLDSQTAWAIVSLLKKLANHGLAILCTIHQPSGIIFQQFDRLLLLAKGGRTVYFGDIGENATALTGYFERHDAVQCRPEENPAEWMLHVIGAAPGAHTDRDWIETWKASSEFHGVQKELDSLAQSRHVTSEADTQDTSYAASVSQQFLACTQRVAQQYWRTPTYIYSKLSLCFITSLFIGLSFQNSPLSLQGLQNQLFSIFMLLVIFAFLIYQTMPGFVTQRTLYEGRERSSKTYAWYNLILANTVIEMAWNSVASLAIYFPFYFLVGMYDNGRITDTQHERGAFMFLLTWAFMVYEGTFAHIVLVPYSSLPGFWTFMYRVSPLTYLIGAMISNGVGKQELTCSEIEFLQFQTPENLTCDEYVGQFVQAVGGALSNPGSNQTCLYCPIASTDTYLTTMSIRYSERWRNFGLLWAFIVFDVIAAFSSEFLATTTEPEGALGQPTSGNVVVSGDAEAVDSHDGAVFGIYWFCVRLYQMSLVY